jgi:hypothetical protein
MGLDGIFIHIICTFMQVTCYALDFTLYFKICLQFQVCVCIDLGYNC